MADLVEVKVPDIGDFADVPVIEVLVSPGDEVALEDPLVTLESDKATMDIPAPRAGTVAEVKVVGGRHRLRGLADPAARAGGSGRRRARCGRPGRRRGAGRGGGRLGAGARRGRPRAGRGARRRAGRLHGGLPRRRSRSAGGADRPRRDARRRVPERGLHPLQGPAARRARARRVRGAERFRRLLRAPGDRHRRDARLEGRCGGEADGGARRAGAPAQGRGDPRRRAAHRPERHHRADGRRRDDRGLRALHHRGGLEPRLAARSARRRARHGLHGRAGRSPPSPSACSSSAAGSSAWRWPPSTTRSAPR